MLNIYGLALWVTVGVQGEIGPGVLCQFWGKQKPHPPPATIGLYPHPIPAMALDSLIPADLRPWFVLPAIWRQSMDTISDKAFARLEAVQYHLAGMPVRWRDGFAIVELSDAPSIALPTDFKRPEDLARVLESATAIAANSALAQLPSPFQMRTLRDCPDWYRRWGFRVAYPLTCNVLYCPGGQWGSLPAIDLGAISA